MVRHYFKISVRNLLKQKVYSIINIGGLAIGLACFILIYIFVRYEFSFDRFYPNAGRIYSVYQKQDGNVFLGSDFFGVTPALLPYVLMQDYPEVIQATGISERSVLFSNGGNLFWENGILTDEKFFRVFPFKFNLGNPATALEGAGNIVLTRSLARKIFKEGNPLGHEVGFWNDRTLIITAVVEDPPENSSLRFSFIASLHADPVYQEQMKRTTWRGSALHTFFTLADGASIQSVEDKFPETIKKYQDPAAYKDYPFRDHYFVKPLKNWHLTSAINFDIGVKGNPTYLYLFSAIALIVLMLACINYMNLAVARSISRSKEVGLRKVIGARRRQLLFQFLGESVLMAFISFLISLILVYRMLPVFGKLVDRDLDFNVLFAGSFLAELFALIILVGLIAGSYPAIFMSGLKPVSAFKGAESRFAGEFTIHQWLILGQFAVSLLLITCSLVIWQQLNYMQNKDLGFNKEHIVTMQIRDPSLMNNYKSLSNEWLKIPGISDVTASSCLPTDINATEIINSKPGSLKEDERVLYTAYIDYDFVNLFGIKVVAGRNFSRAAAEDSINNCLLNVTAVKMLGWTPGEAVGKQFYHNDRLTTVIGVVNDFNMHSMHMTIAPLMLQFRSQDWYVNYISLKIQPGEVPSALAAIGNKLKKFSPYPFDYQFLDEHFRQLYDSDVRLGKTFGFFTILSILIAAMGLFGLAAYTTSRRVKEIGIRKVLGATLTQNVSLVSRKFLLLVGGGFIVSVPLTVYIMHRWLQNFAYRIDIHWWIFLVTGLLSFIITSLAVGYQSVKASLINPVDCLRSE